MASDPLGSLDEFFDFAQLESDMGHGLHAECQSQGMEEVSMQAFPDLILNSTMEWESSLDAPDYLVALPSHPIQENLSVNSEQHSPVPADLPYASLDWPCQVEPYHGHQVVGEKGIVQLLHPDGISITDSFAQDISPPSASSLGSVEHPVADIGDIRGGRSSPLEETRHTLEPPSSSYKAQAPAQLRHSSAGNRKPASARRKGPSSRIPLEARQMLEEEFTTNPYPCAWELDIIAHQANLEVKRVRNWFNNTRARKKGPGGSLAPDPVIQLIPAGDEDLSLVDPTSSNHSLATKLSAESLEALSKQVEAGVPAPQRPLAFYLASSYLEEAAEYSDIQAAVNLASPSERGDSFMDSSSASRRGKSGSVITSHTSSDGSAPTTYTMSSGGSNISSFGRDRRRGRRRMPWRASPYSRSSPYQRSKIEGLYSAGAAALASQNQPFFCTFCPRAFKTKYEWIRHEDSVHALRTTWICCSSKQEPLQLCPFCGQKHPDEAHMAGHKYQQCRNKPETHRTFYRRDHFIQHLHHVHFANVKHPSVDLGCQSRTATEQLRGYGCKELSIKWRRFGAPMRSDDPMLHCGFCGKKMQDWNTRCDHVAEHLLDTKLDRSVWWPERKETHLENLCVPQTAGPFRCRYCQKVFANTEAMNNHSECQVWSCRFLRTFDDVASGNAGPPLCHQFPSPKAHHCHLCGAGYKSDHIEHAQQYHKYRLCEQNLYTSEGDFLQHLHDFHGASHPLLLQRNVVLEQHFSRNRDASFESVDFDEILQGCRDATPAATFVDPFTVDENVKFLASIARRASDDLPRSSPSRRKARERIAEAKDIQTKVRPRFQKEAPPKPESQGPRFFRLDPLMPFLSPRIYYLRNAKMSNLFSDGEAFLEEVSHSHIASLVMSSGLVGMASARLPIQMIKDETNGLVELSLEEHCNGRDTCACDSVVCQGKSSVK